MALAIVVLLSTFAMATARISFISPVVYNNCGFDVVGYKLLENREPNVPDFECNTHDDNAIWFSQGPNVVKTWDLARNIVFLPDLEDEAVNVIDHNPSKSTYGNFCYFTFDSNNTLVEMFDLSYNPVVYLCSK